MNKNKNIKLWGGRFKKGLAPSAKKLSYSLDVDKRLAKYDIKVNLSHSKALKKAGYITKEELDKITLFFKQLEKEIELGKHDFSDKDEDIHSHIERLLTEAHGELGKKIHTGKSRNDQVNTDFKMFIKEEIGEIENQLKILLRTLYKMASEHKKTYFPSFTHFQPAQPIILAHHLLAYFEMFQRDLIRFEENKKHTNSCPLGSGALAGNNYELDREFIRKELGFDNLTNNSMDAVADRDYVIEFIGNSNILMTHLSRFSEEIILWSSPLIKFIEINDQFSTGSSIMPQKKNPDIAELIRGKTGRVLGNFSAMVNCIKALPLTYNRDLQEDKEALFDTTDTIKQCLIAFNEMLESIIFKKKEIKSAMKKGYLCATELADYLVKQKIPFREAHKITGEIVLYAINQKKQLEELTLNEFQKFSKEIKSSIFETLTIENAVNAKNVYGGTAENQIKIQLKKIEEKYKWQ